MKSFLINEIGCPIPMTSPIESFRAFLGVSNTNELGTRIRIWKWRNQNPPHFLIKINARSEFVPGFGPISVNALGTRSEWPRLLWPPVRMHELVGKGQDHSGCRSGSWPCDGVLEVPLSSPKCVSASGCSPHSAHFKEITERECNEEK
jgi:hypothetical protein